MHGILEEIVHSRKESFGEQVKHLLHPAKGERIMLRHPISYALLTARKKKQAGIIAEFKRNSPSRSSVVVEGMIEAKTRLDIYNAYNVDAVSILTEPLYFKGSYDDLYLATTTMNVPVLCKDFITLPEQLEVAARLGASNALIIVKIPESFALVDRCIELGMEPLLEIHDDDDLDKIVNLSTENKDITLVGINNRNLDTLEVSLDISKRLIPLVKEKLPDNTVIVSESGVKDINDIITLKHLGADGFLIGTTFMNTPIDKLGEIISQFKCMQPRK